MKSISLAFLACVLALPAIAECPAESPVKKWNTHDGDLTLNKVDLEKRLVGRIVKISNSGSEFYRRSGEYRYTEKGQKFHAPSYKIYSNGVRCIDYDKPRFDKFVVNNKRLIMIDAQGGRFETKVK